VKKTFRPEILVSPLFVLSLGLLLLNDCYLKYEHSNYLTGKLSDFAGLFIFPFFLSSLRITRAREIYFGTAIFFIFLKTGYSQPMIDGLHAVGFGFNRVVDQHDIIALMILPFSYHSFLTQLKAEKRKSKYLTMPISAISIFAIWATSLPREQVLLNLEVDAVYTLNMGKSELLSTLKVGHNMTYRPGENLQDSVFYLHFVINDGYKANITAVSTITSIDSSATKIRLDSVTHGYLIGGLFTGVDKDDITHFKSLSAKDFKSLFETNFIEKIRSGKTKNIYFDKKDVN
jgi:hypothetical protein